MEVSNNVFKAVSRAIRKTMKSISDLIIVITSMIICFSGVILVIILKYLHIIILGIIMIVLYKLII